MRLSHFDYDLPEDYIAQEPAEPRDSCRLLAFRRCTGETTHHIFRELPELLRPGDCLVLNDTRVFPARLYGAAPGGAPVELLLLRPRDGFLRWEALARPARRMAAGKVVEFPGSSVRATVASRVAEGKIVLDFQGLQGCEWSSFLSAHGHAPLPPYIRRPVADPEQYQTVYSRVSGSVAAPTAGLHFTEQLLSALRARDILPVHILLHIGYGTFQPVRTETVESHRMEEEYYEVRAAAAAEINARRLAGGRVVAVGTSATRTLETVYRPGQGIMAERGHADLFIYPGFEYRALDGLLTNFHLPRSSPLLLTAAWAGWDRLRRVYSEAIRLGYRFYSFGDAMLVI
jgi:S-adenosylmethionine:tRNA ribosyltransferase-isomerase